MDEFNHNVRVGAGAWILTLALTSGFALRVHAADTQAKDILKKMITAYALQTYQGTAVLTLKGVTEDNKPFILKGAQEVTYKSPSLFVIKAEGEVVGGTEISCCDGKQSVTYHSAGNQYMKTPLRTNAGKGAKSLLHLLNIAVDPQSGKMVGSGAVGGHAAYLIQALPAVTPLKPDATQQERAIYQSFKKTLQPFELAIDKKDYHLLRAVQTSSETQMTRTLEFTQQSFNPVLADSAFVFTPPPGAQSATVAANRKAFGGSVNNFGKSAMSGATASEKRGGSPVPPPHASPGAGGANARP